MKCPSCDHGEMMERTQDEKLSFGGQSLTLHGMKGEFCTKCDEGYGMLKAIVGVEKQVVLLSKVK